MKALRILPLLALLAVAGCGEDSPIINPLTDSMTAMVSGSAWNTVVVSAANAGGVTTITGTRSITSASDIIVIALPTVTAPGTFPLGGVNSTGAQGSYRRDTTNYVTSPLTLASSGTLTVSSVGNGRIAGTFNFTAYRNADPTTGDSVVITNGTFNCKLN